MNLEELIRKLQELKRRKEKLLNDDEDSFNPETRLGEYGGRSSEIDGIYFDEEEDIVIIH